MYFIYLKETLDKCKVDSDCEYQQFCNDEFFCEHRGLWPVNVLDVIGKYNPN